MELGEKSGPPLMLGARIVLAVLGGYAIAALAAACLARFLPLQAAQASVTGQLASFAAYAALVIYAFSVRSVPRLALHFAFLGAVLALALWLSFGGGVQP